MVEFIGTGQLRRYGLAIFHRTHKGVVVEILRRGKVTARIIPPHIVPAIHRPTTFRSAADCGVTLNELRNDAAHYLDRVASGEIIEVFQRGTLLGRIVPAIGGNRLASVPS